MNTQIFFEGVIALVEKIVYSLLQPGLQSLVDGSWAKYFENNHE